MTNGRGKELTLGELLDAPGFDLKLLTPGRSAHSRPIHGAHSIEISGPARWLPEHWVMLTTGVRLRGRPAEQRRLVAELEDGGIAALGFGVGVVFKEAPKALLVEAERLEFPVFTIPYNLPFREVEVFVNRSLVSTDLYVLQRVVSMQDYLMNALQEDRPEPVLVRRLASMLTGAEVALVEVDGSVTAATGSRASAAWELVRRSSRLHEFEHNGRWGVAARVERGNQPPAWLIVLTAGDEAPRPLVKPVTRAAAHLLALPSLARDNAARRRLERRRLAVIIHDSPDQLHDARFLKALAEAGLALLSRCRVVLFGTGPSDEGDALSSEHLLQRIEDLFDHHNVSHVSAACQEMVFTFVQDELESLESWLRDTFDSRLNVYAAVGQGIVDQTDVPRSLMTARVALSELRRSADDRRVLRYGSIDPLTLLLTSSPDPAMHDRLASSLSPLTRDERLLDTLRTYFASDLSVNRAAHALRIHPNSLRYRLNRIERLLGSSLSSPRTLAVLYLALLDSELPHAASTTRTPDDDGRAPASRQPGSAVLEKQTGSDTPPS